jgi:putative hydrolase of the HAD superfamily
VSAARRDVKTRWLTFDLDGTVIADPFGRVILPRIDAHFAAALGPRRARDVLAERQRALSLTDRVAVFDWDALAGWLGHETGIPWSHDVVAMLQATLGSLPPWARSRLVYREVVPALQELRGQGWRIGALTNGYARYQQPILVQLGLADLFDAIIAPDVTGYAKPDPRILTAFGAGLEVRAHIGDLLSQDVYLARQLGVTAIWLRRGRSGTAVTRRTLQRRLAVEQREVPHDLGPEDVWPDAMVADVTTIGKLVGLARCKADCEKVRPLLRDLPSDTVAPRKGR